MKKDPRDYIALYRDSGEWRLITRETATEKHAKKMAETYRSYGHKTKIIKISD